MLYIFIYFERYGHLGYVSSFSEESEKGTEKGHYRELKSVYMGTGLPLDKQ